MRALVAVIAVLLLSGCWEGDDLYSAADARPAIPPGPYGLVSDDGEPPIAVRVSVLPSGMTRLTAGGETEDFPMAPLDAEGRMIVHWLEPRGAETDADALELYLLIERRPGGEYAFYMPRCEGEEAAIARAAGAGVRLSSNVAVCRFPDRASLESALRRLRPDPAALHWRLVPSADGAG
jgi:hypothetical protein